MDVENLHKIMQEVTKHVVSILILGAIVFVASVAILGYVDIKDPIIAGLVVQVINTLKDLFRAPSYSLFGAIADSTTPKENKGEKTTGE